jgi:hypothetical protein
MHMLLGIDLEAMEVRIYIFKVEDGLSRTVEKTRNPKPEPKIPRIKILFGIFGWQLVKPVLILGNSGTTTGYPNFHVSCTYVIINYHFVYIKVCVITTEKLRKNISQTKNVGFYDRRTFLNK